MTWKGWALAVLASGCGGPSPFVDAGQDSGPDASVDAGPDEADAGLPDGGVADAGRADGGVTDGGTADAGLPDGGVLLPWFRVTRSPVPARTTTANFSEVDPVAGGSVDRRDEIVELRVTLDRGVVDDSSVQVGLRGVPATVLSSLPGDAGCSGGCPDSGLCRCFHADLSVPAFDVVRGDITIEVTGQLPGGGSVTETSAGAPARIPTLHVTRWAWSRRFFSGGSPAQIAEPAVDAHGRAVVSGRYMGTASLSSIDPRGQVAWSTNDYAVAPIVVGEDSDAGQTIFVPRTFSGLGVFDANDGGLLPQGFGTFPTSIQYAMSLAPSGTFDGGPKLIGLYDTGAPTTQFPFAYGPGGSVSTGMPLSVAASNGFGVPVANGGELTTTTNMALRVDTWTGSGWQPFKTATWLKGSFAFAAVGSEVVGSSYYEMGPAFFRRNAAGTIDWQYPSVATYGGLGIAVWGASTLVGLHYSGPNGVTTFTVIPIGAAAPTATRVMPTPYANGPALAPGGLAYTVDYTGQLSLWALPSLTERWPSASIAAADTFRKSPMLDCGRAPNGTPRAGPGRLLIASETGRLYAIVTDTRGIDPSSAWPKAYRDPRNTNNGLTPLTEFSCP